MKVVVIDSDQRVNSGIHESNKGKEKISSTEYVGLIFFCGL